MTTAEGLEALVDRLFGLIEEATAPEIKTLVIHRRPDVDAWLCLWIARKFIPKTADAEVVFTNAGTSVADSSDPSVLHFDTGGGEFDQHEKRLQRSCSAVLLAKGFGLLEDPGLEPLLEMATKVDNVEPLDPTSIHYVIEGYPSKFQKDGNVDWDTIQSRVFEAFDILYSRHTRIAQSREDLNKYVRWATLQNGLRVATLLWHPECRDAAYEQGAAVVVWTISQGKNRFYVGVQKSRNYPHLHLVKVADALRREEARSRGVNVENQNLGYFGLKGDIVPGWFFHDSANLILCGGRSHKLKPEEYTRLTPNKIVETVQRTLASMPTKSAVRV